MNKYFGYYYWPDNDEHWVIFLNLFFVNSIKRRQRFIENRPWPWAKRGLPAHKMWRKYF